MSNLNMSQFLDQPWDTIWSSFTDFFQSYTGYGSVFWLFLLAVFTFGIYMKSEGNGALTTMFMIISGATLGSAHIFLNQPEMSLAFYLFAAFGVAGLFMNILYQGR